MRFNIVFEDDVPTQVKVVHKGEVYQAPSTHPSFTAILGRLAANPDDTSVVNLFDPQAALNEVFQQVSPRVSVINGIVLYDGDVLHNGVSKQIIRFVEEGNMDQLSAVAAFTERVMRNPSENSRNQLFAWLDKFDFTITPEGKFVAYKAVYLDENGVGVSSQAAPLKDQVRVDGVLVENVPVRNLPGSVVTMPRSLVADNVYEGCSTGLHCGTWEYAKQFLGWSHSGGHILEVHVDPVDVVSVPHDSDTQKIRVCRYEVIGVVEDKYTRAVLEAKAEPTAVDDEFVPYGESAEWVPESTTVEVPDDDEAEGFPVGAKVRSVKPLYNQKFEFIGVGSEGTVVRNDHPMYIQVQFNGNVADLGEWQRDRFERVEVVDVTKAEKVDTRQNYKAQKRYPKGHALAGRFIKKDSPDYNLF